MLIKFTVVCLNTKSNRRIVLWHTCKREIMCIMCIWPITLCLLGIIHHESTVERKVYLHYVYKCRFVCDDDDDPWRYTTRVANTTRLRSSLVCATALRQCDSSLLPHLPPIFLGVSLFSFCHLDFN